MEEHGGTEPSVEVARATYLVTYDDDGVPVIQPVSESLAVSIQSAISAAALERADALDLLAAGADPPSPSTPRTSREHFSPWFDSDGRPIWDKAG